MVRNQCFAAVADRRHPLLTIVRRAVAFGNTLADITVASDGDEITMIEEGWIIHCQHGN